MSGTQLDADGVPEDIDDEFLDRLEAVAEAEERVASLTAELERIDIGLDEEDTRRLLWAHLTGWSLSDISETFDAVDGLWIPPEVREFNRQIVFRTPRATIQHFGSEPLDPYYGMITEDSFGNPK